VSLGSHPGRMALAFLAFLCLGFLAALPRPSFDNSVSAWLPQNHPELAAYHAYRDDFGSDEVIVIHLVGGADEGRLRLVAELSESLAELRSVERILSATTAFDTETEVLLDKSLGGFNSATWKRLGWVFQGPLNRSLRLYRAGDPKTNKPGEACLYATIKPGRSAERGALIERLREAETQGRAAGMEVQVAGQPIVNFELDRAAKSVDLESLPVLLAICIVVLILVTRSPRLTLAMFLPVGLGVLASEGVLTLAGINSNLITAISKPLLLVLTLSGALHIVVAFQQARGLGLSPSQAAWAAADLKRSACLLAFLTTAIGFGSLAVSDVDPIRQFGWITALGLGFGALVVLLLVPAALAIVGSPPEPAGDPSTQLSEFLVKIGRAWPVPLVIVSGVIVALGTAATTQLVVETNAVRYFPKAGWIRSNHIALEADGLGTANLELILHAKPGQFRDREVLVDASALAQEFAKAPTVCACLGLPLLLRESSFRSARVDALPAAHFLPDIWEELEEQRETLVTKDASRLRLSLVIPSIDAEKLAKLEQSLRQTFAGSSCRSRGITLQITGVYRLLLDTQSSLISTLTWSLLGTMALMQIVFFMILRSLRLGLLALLPNLFPLAINFLLMALLRVPLDVGTCMTATVALGIAVDGTIHFLGSWQKAGLEGAARCTGKAVIMGSLVIATGFASLSRSEFGPTAAFGLLCAAAMFFAMLGDLILLPALLCLGAVAPPEQDQSALPSCPRSSSGSEPS